MYFINIKQLKADIVNRDFNERDRFIYMFIYIIGYVLVSELTYLFEENLDVVTLNDYVYSVGMVLITIVGTYYLYKANRGGDGEDFTGRYFSITWVMGIRFLLPYLVVLTSLIFLMSSDIDTNTLDITFTVFSLIYIFAIFFCSYRHIVDINSRIDLKK